MKKIISFLFKNYLKRKEQEKYIKERMKEYAMNIDEYFIGQVLFDKDGNECIITDKTLNTIEVFTKKKKKGGIDSRNWFEMRGFNKANDFENLFKKEKEMRNTNKNKGKKQNST